MHDAKNANAKEFKVWGTGNPLREFLFVDDLAIQLILIDRNVDFDLLNVGSGLEISIKDLAYKIKDTVGFKGQIVFDGYVDGNPESL